jgi:hypothetical protein
MNRLYQWLSERASFFHSERSGGGASHTIRTEVTVQWEGITLLVGGAAAGLDACPLCGTELAPTQAQRVNGRLLKGSISQKSSPLDRAPP